MKTLLLMLSLFPCLVMAYDPVTHELLASESMKKSILINSSSNILVNIGLKNELSDETIQDFPNSNEDNKSIEDLIRFGSDFEDDVETKRSFNHFYDPVKDRPLTIIGGFQLGVTSPDWALEDNGDISTLFSGEQYYSYKEAMNYFYTALTSLTETDRNSNWGLMFQSLGHIIHHIHDMAQPQHVRNDDHCDDLLKCGVLGLYDPSWYEEYTSIHMSTTIPSYITLDYPIPNFPTAREFWTTPTDTGLADFTNRNFFSKDSNFQFNNGIISTSAEYQYPIPDMIPISRNISDPDLLGVAGQILCDDLKLTYTLGNPVTGDCYIDFIKTSVIDELNSSFSSDNPKASSLSIFDDELTFYNSSFDDFDEDGDIVTVDRKPSLNEFNFKAAHSYLIPRAVAYSAGLINHFFRGKIDMTRSTTGSGWDIENLSNEDMQGTFTVYYDYIDQVDGIEKRETIENATWADLSIAANDSFTVADYTAPENLIRRILVFTGSIGSEYAVTANVIQKSWGTPILISSISQQSMSEPRIGVDSIGNVLVAWEQQSVGELNIWSNRYDTLTGLWDAAPFQTDAGTGNKSSYVHTELIYVGIANDTGHVIWKEFVNFSSYLPFENQLQMTTNLWRGVLVNAYPINTSNPEPPPTFVFNAPGGIVEIVEQSGNINARHYSADTVSIESLSGVSSDATIIANSQGKIFAAWVQLDDTDYGIYVNTYQN